MYVKVWVFTSHARLKGCNDCDKEPIENKMTVNEGGDVSQNATCALSLNSCRERWRREERACCGCVSCCLFKTNLPSTEVLMKLLLAPQHIYANHFSSSKVCAHSLFWFLLVFLPLAPSPQKNQSNVYTAGLNEHFFSLCTVKYFHLFFFLVVFTLQCACHQTRLNGVQA